MTPPAQLPAVRTADDITRTIRNQNDRFRTSLGCCPISGRIVITRGVSSLPPPVQMQVLLAVRNFSAFDPGDDPYQEHDFGAFEVRGEPYYFKIDYFAPELETGSDDPSDLDRTIRVLTIMHARDY